MAFGGTIVPVNVDERERPAIQFRRKMVKL